MPLGRQLLRWLDPELYARIDKIEKDHTVMGKNHIRYKLTPIEEME